MTPSPISTLTFLLLLLLSTILTTTSRKCTNLISQTCQDAAQSSPNINYDFCVNAFESDQSSQCADRYGLGLISINLLKKNVTHTTIQIKEMLDSGDFEGKTVAGLSTCLKLYLISIETANDATNSYNHGDFNSANIKVSAVMTNADTCEEQFEELGVKSPLKEQNDNTLQLSAISLAIMKMNYVFALLVRSS